jgi:hypothetical protein
LAEIDKRFALIDKDDNYFYPFQKAQKETNRYGFALTAVGEQDRHGGGTYTTSIEEVVRRVVREGWSVRAKTLDGKSGSYGLKKRTIVRYELDEKLFRLLSSDDVKPSNLSKRCSIETTSNDSPTETPYEQYIRQTIKSRRGQSKFREALLNAFDGKCCVTGSSVVSVLEAAHIAPHSEETDYSVANGLLLRADVHTLYDLHLLSIDPFGMVHLSDDLWGSEYEKYDGQSALSYIPTEMKENLSSRHDRRFLVKCKSS